MRANPVKGALKAAQPLVGTWLSLGSITVARFMARAGFSWLTTDIEHSEELLIVLPRSITERPER